LTAKATSDDELLRLRAAHAAALRRAAADEALARAAARAALQQRLEALRRQRLGLLDVQALGGDAREAAVAELDAELRHVEAEAEAEAADAGASARAALVSAQAAELDAALSAAAAGEAERDGLEAQLRALYAEQLRVRAGRRALVCSCAFVQCCRDWSSRRWSIA
jgi:hypothetical protein